MDESLIDVEVADALLGGRQAVYALMARLWADPLDEAAAAVVSSSEWPAVLEMFDGMAGSDGEKGIEAVGDAQVRQLSLVGRWREIAAAVERLGVEGCRRAFNWCFMGIGTRVAPWESVYAAGERLVMQPSTLEVREAYAAAGFAARNKGSEPDDHVATECDFMAKLAERAASAYREGDIDACGLALSQSRSFLRGHLIPHAPAFAQAFEEAAACAGAHDEGCAADAMCLYGSLARFGEAFLPIDRDVVDRLHATVLS